MHRLYWLLVCLLALVPAFAKDALPGYASICGPELAISTIHSAKLSVCDDNVKQCQVRKDAKVVVSIDFTPPIQTQNLTKYISYGPFNELHFEERVSCAEAGLSCPLPAGKPAHYAETADMSKMPQGANKLEWVLLSENLDELACVDFAVVFV